MANWPTYQYRGDGKPAARPQPHAHTTPEPYRPASPALIDAVNLSIFLQRPLLLEGEAGSGKSRLAYAVAYELGLPLKVWHVRSTEKAEDGLYRFDAIRRLYDAQAHKPGEQIDPQHDPQNMDNYCHLGQLGEAFDLETSPAVVLIDEIDKADLDFPNDLLNVLEESTFTIRETGRKVTAQHKPIVFITSNKEKGNLPLPFLRRCVYHYVRFPETEAALLEIVQTHYPDEQQRPLNAGLAEAAIQRFMALRNESLQKKPGTSELLDWLAALHFFKNAPYPAADLPDNLPYPELLFKLQTDFGSHLA